MQLNQLAIESYKKLSRYIRFPLLQVKVEISKDCNLSCRGCRRTFPNTIAYSPGIRNLYLDQLKELVEGSMVRVVRFTGDGEPWCNPAMERILYYLKSKGIKSHLTTNATLLNKKRIELMEECGVTRISVSFDGATEEQYRYYRDDSNYKEVLNTCSQIGKSRIQLFMNCVLYSDEIVEDLPKYIVMSKMIGASGVLLIKYQSEEEDRGYQLDPQKHGLVLGLSKAMATDYGLIVKGNFNADPQFSECEDTYTCPWVSLDGKVYACSYMANRRTYEMFNRSKYKVPHTDYIMGETSKGLSKIWRNQAYKELQRTLKKSRMPQGHQITKDILSLLKTRQTNKRFSYCIGCLCRWGETGM